MAQKVNPISLRLKKTNRSFDSSWFSDSNYVTLLMRDLKIQQYINLILKKIKYCSARYLIQNLPNKIKISVFFCNPNKNRRHMCKVFYLNYHKKNKKVKKNFFNTQQHTIFSIKQNKIFQYLMTNFNSDLSKIDFIETKKIKLVGNSHNDNMNKCNLNMIGFFKNYLKLLYSIKKSHEFYIRYFLVKYFSIKFKFPAISLSSKKNYFFSTLQTQIAGKCFKNTCFNDIFSKTENSIKFKHKQNILLFYVVNFLFFKIYKNKKVLALNYFEIKKNFFLKSMLCVNKLQACLNAKLPVESYNDLTYKQLKKNQSLNCVQVCFASMFKQPIGNLHKSNKLSAASSLKHEKLSSTLYLTKNFCDLQFNDSIKLTNYNYLYYNKFKLNFFSNIQHTNNFKQLNIEKRKLEFKTLPNLSKNFFFNNFLIIKLKILNYLKKFNVKTINSEKNFIPDFNFFTFIIQLNKNYKNLQFLNNLNTLSLYNLYKLNDVKHYSQNENRVNNFKLHNCNTQNNSIDTFIYKKCLNQQNAKYYHISLINNQYLNDTYNSYCKLSEFYKYYNFIFSYEKINFSKNFLSLPNSNSLNSSLKHSSYHKRTLQNNVSLKQKKKLIIMNPPYKHHIETIASNYACTHVNLNFFQTRNIFQNALFLIDEIIYYIEKKLAFFKIKNYILKKLTQQKFSYVKGIRVMCSGRIKGKSKKAQRSKIQNFKYGETSLHVFSSKIDFRSKNAFTSFGTLGVKIWICYH